MNRNIYIHGQEVYKKLAREYKICIMKTNEITNNTHNQ